MTLSLPFSIRVDGCEPDIQAFAGELRSQPWFSEFHFNSVEYDIGYQLWIYSNDDDSAEEVERERENWILETCARHNLVPMEMVHDH
jgi:hypothetical protein